MSAFGPLDYLGARSLAYKAGAAQGGRGTLGRALGLWHAPTEKDPYQDELRLLAQQKAQEEAVRGAEVARRQEVADAETAFGRNVVLEQLRQSGREGLLGDRLAQERETFKEQEARLREQHASGLAAQATTAEAQRATAEQVRQTSYGKWLHGAPGRAAVKSKGQLLATGLPEPFRSAALAKLDEGQWVAERKKYAEAEAKANERRERDEARRDERQTTAAATEGGKAVTAEARVKAERLRAFSTILRDMKRDRDKERIMEKSASRYAGWSDEQLEDEALATLERSEAATALPSAEAP